MSSRSASVAARFHASRPIAKPRSALCAVYANGVTVVGVSAATAWYSDHVLQLHGTHWVESEKGSSSMKHSRSAMSSRTSSRTGAMPRPQLPITIVVIP